MPNFIKMLIIMLVLTFTHVIYHRHTPCPCACNIHLLRRGKDLINFFMTLQLFLSLRCPLTDAKILINEFVHTSFASDQLLFTFMMLSTKVIKKLY